MREHNLRDADAVLDFLLPFDVTGSQVHGNTQQSPRLNAQELQRSEAYLAEAQRLSHTGSFGWNPDTGEVVWSDETYRIFEYDRATEPTLDMLVQRLHPHDRAFFQQVIDRATQTATDFEHEYLSSRFM
jgi:PAS domain-containing protein